MKGHCCCEIGLCASFERMHCFEVLLLQSSCTRSVTLSYAEHAPLGKSSAQ